MYRSLFSRDLFAEFDRLQREMAQAFDPLDPTIGGRARGGYPALNVGNTPQSVEIYAFAPGVDPSTIDVQVDRGVLSISGQRPPVEAAAKAALHVNERFAGGFHRVVSLPDDADAGAVTASYRDGVLRISIKRRESAQPRRITVQ